MKGDGEMYYYRIQNGYMAVTSPRLGYVELSQEEYEHVVNNEDRNDQTSPTEEAFTETEMIEILADHEYRICLMEMGKDENDV